MLVDPRRRTTAVRDEGVVGRPATRRERRLRAAFLVVGLVPSAWLLRRLPIGLWYMAGGWTLFAAGLVAPVVAVRAFRRREVTRGLVVDGALLLLGAGMLVMMVVSRADARGDDLLATDGPVRVAALIGQVAVAVAAVRAARSRGTLIARRAAVAYGAAVASAALGALVASAVPDVLFVVIVGVVASRFAYLTIDDDPDAPDRPGRSAAVLFTWSVAVLALQARLLSTTAGIALTAAAFVVGLAVLAARAQPSGRRRVATLATATFLPVLFGLTVLLPSLADSRFLLDIGLAKPDGLELEDELTRSGLLERWYSMPVNKAAEGVREIIESFRSPPVSVWPRTTDRVVGHLFGYRLVVIGFDLGERTPPGSPCSTETRSCIRVTVERSTE